MDTTTQIYSWIYMENKRAYLFVVIEKSQVFRDSPLLEVLESHIKMVQFWRQT